MKTTRNVSPMAQKAASTPAAPATSSTVRIGRSSSIRRVPPWFEPGSGLMLDTHRSSIAEMTKKRHPLKFAVRDSSPTALATAARIVGRASLSRWTRSRRSTIPPAP